MLTEAIESLKGRILCGAARPILGAALAASLSIAATQPARSQNVTLQGEPIDARLGQPVMLTAKADQQVMEPNELMIYDCYGENLLAHCPNTTVCTFAVTNNSPIAPWAACFVGVIGIPTEFFGNAPVVAVSNGVYPDWLNTLKFYVFRFTFGYGQVNMDTDSGGAPITPPWHVMLVHADADNGAIVSDCSGYPHVLGCVGVEVNASAGQYQALISMGGTDRASAITNDGRALTRIKCVDAADPTSPSTCP